jgi:hypothetical protein
LRAAGAAAYSLAEDPGGTELFAVCAWNAFALQTVADQLLASDDRFDPATAGRLPPSTLAFAQECYTQAVRWVDAARSARANPAYRPAWPLPAALPAWPRWEGVRPVHIRCLRDAYDAIAPRAELDLQEAHDAEADLLVTELHSAVETADALGAHARSPQQLREVCDALVRGLSAAYTLGQVSAMPSLANVLRLRGRRAHPLNAIQVGWPVLDPSGTRVGTVTRVEGEPALGLVTGLFVTAGSLSPDRRIDAREIHAVGAGFVRLS